MPHIFFSESGQHWFRQWLVAYSAPSHYLNQCWVIVNWTLRNKLQWIFNQNTKPFIHENASEYIVCEIAAILFRERWVNHRRFNASGAETGVCRETLQWRHNERDSVSNHQPHDCLLNRLFRRRSKKTSKLRVTGLCAGNSPGTGEFPAQMASYAENVSIWWRHHELCQYHDCRWHGTLCRQSSAAMVLCRPNKCVLVFQGEGFQLPVPHQGLYSLTRLILVLCQANERRRYKVTPPLIGWAQTYDQSWLRWHRLIGIRIPIINMRRSSDRLRFIMGIPIPARRRFFLVNKGPCRVEKLK